jgi:hypothetical protein
MALVEKTIELLAGEMHGGISQLDFILSTYNPEHESFAGECVNIVLDYLEKASEDMAAETLIEEYNTLADDSECGHIDYWDRCPSMDLEMFIEEVFGEISACSKELRLSHEH